jgi:hypothetical protein
MVLMVVGIIYLKWERTLPAKVILSRTTLPRTTVSKVALPNYGNGLGQWKVVGKPLKLTFHVHDLKLFSWKENIFLAYTQVFDEKLDGFDQSLTILKWNGKEWIQIGKWDGLAELSKICIGSWKGKLCAVIAKSVYVKSNKIRELVQLVQWDREKWTQTVRSFIFKKNFVFLSCFKIDHGIPYVGLLRPGEALSEGNDGSLIKYMNHSWSYVGAPCFFKHVQGSLSLAFLKGIPFLTCNKGGFPLNKPYVFKFNGTTWHPHPILKNDQDTSSAFLKFHGQLYLLLYVVNEFDAATMNKILLLKYQKNRWIRMSSVVVPKNPDAWRLFSYIDSLGNIYTAFANEQERATVLRFNGVRWNYLGNPSFSTTAAWPFSFAEYKHRLYIAFADNLDADVEDSDHHSGKRIEVMRYIAP